MENPLVSIITPAFNCKKTFEETYKSVKSQVFSEYEWIIIEDNSTDDSYDFIKKIVDTDDKITLLKTDKNLGAAEARNIGIEHAKGRYIAFLDADDLWEKDKLEKQIKFMQEGNLAFTYTNYKVLYPSGKQGVFDSKLDSIEYKKLLKSNYIGCLTVVYDSVILGKVYMPKDCYKREDHGAWLDILKKGFTAYRLNEVLATYRIGENNTSSKKFDMFKYQYKMFRVHENFSRFKSFRYSLIIALHKAFKKY